MSIGQKRVCQVYRGKTLASRFGQSVEESTAPLPSVSHLCSELVILLFGTDGLDAGVLYRRGRRQMKATHNRFHRSSPAFRVVVVRRMHYGCAESVVSTATTANAKT